MTHSELVSHAHRWLENQRICRVALKEFNGGVNGEIPDVLGIGRWGNSVLIECKVSRADFLGDKKKNFRINYEKGMGKYRIYACSWGLIKVEELPEKWGLIYINEKGFVRSQKHVLPKRAYGENQNAFEYNLLSEHSFLMNALNRIRYRGLMERVYEPLPNLAAYN